MLAFTLMMAAWSLRAWRRNGVACDELLFLPGTLHGHEHGVEGPLIELPTPTATSLPENNDTASSRRSPSEADMAAGGFSIRKLVAAGAGTMRRRQSFEEMGPLSEEPSYVTEDSASSNYNIDENIEENDNESSLMGEATFVEERQTVSSKSFASCGTFSFFVLHLESLLPTLHMHHQDRLCLVRHWI
mmetsp:Transcript_22120/g.31089  ORF Transcript_22120/g.31089 Transcript_22120/m.31089 type:complete len:188 (-) Transcript_22120:463-1026(-)